jgi:hypothetical protein
LECLDTTNKLQGKKVSFRLLPEHSEYCGLSNIIANIIMFMMASSFSVWYIHYDKQIEDEILTLLKRHIYFHNMVIG